MNVVYDSKVKGYKMAVEGEGHDVITDTLCDFFQFNRDVPIEVYKNFEGAPEGENWWETVDLQKLILAHNNIEVLKEDLKNLPLLTVLNVSHNKLTQLPAAIGELPSLKSLDVSFNLITNIPAEIGSATSLVKVDCSNNQLKELPNSLGQCSDLAELKASNNLIGSLPDDLAYCKKLLKVDIELTEYPVEACRLRLSVLDLSNNSLSGLPAEIGAEFVVEGGAMIVVLVLMVKVEDEDYRLNDKFEKACAYSTLVTGPTAALLKYLRSRLPSAEDAQVMTPSKDNMVAMASRLSITTKELSLADMGLIAVPPEVCEPNEITKVDLSRNSIEELPVTLSACSSLEVLILSRNKIKDWPEDALKSLPKLICLRLDNNPLNKVPLNGFEAVSTLQILDLSGCASSLLDNPAFASLQHLVELYLRRVKLHEVPSDILMLRKLQILDLSQNSLQSIPQGFQNLTSLTELDLSDNSIGTLPSELGLLEPSLQALRLDGNPLRSIRRTILDRGTKAVLQYLKDKI
ncbi:hypothetical protein KSS87_012914 [Heliosperma pusillum]|nr:hypothetical protein KSS87_012914 [Heliosperma pusillum]